MCLIRKLYEFVTKTLAFIIAKFPYKKFFFGLLIVLIVSFAYVAFNTRENPIADKLEREKQNTESKVVNDVTELNPVKVVDIVVPKTIEEIVDAVKTHEHVSIGGGRNSMGGQTASEKAIQIDMREYNEILDFSKEKKEITVQAGARWRDIQEYIDQHNLSVKIMQTYSNFTVGGSLSVNVHGRYMGLGPIIMSVKSFRIVLADGQVVEATPDKNKDIFYGAIGGMGGIGVISDVTLELTDNVNVERSRVKMKTEKYLDYFKEYVRENEKIVFHNADMYPPDFSNVSAVSWGVTDKMPTTESRLIPEKKEYWLERIVWVVMSEWPMGKLIREYVIDPLIYRKQPVHTRNYEASYDTAELEPSNREKSTYVLQEYFVPIENFDVWVPKMKKVFNDNDVNVINVSIRHSKADPGAKLAWARKESFAFVVYYKQGTDEKSKKDVTRWTQDMIEAVLSVDGTYYLPYQLLATEGQLLRAYPKIIEYFEIKKAYDPSNKFTNKLWDKYYSEELLKFYNERLSLLQQLGTTTKDYFRAYDNAYLSIPEWYIVYSADEYAAVLKSTLPSEFSYMDAVKDYWKQHRVVTALVRDSAHNNDDYLLVLQVIGVSFTVENIVKAIYENTIGKVSEMISGNKQVAEDVYAAKVAKEYAELIYDYPWYEFSYLNALKGVWSIDSSFDHSLGQSIRRFERKVFLTIEYGIKTLYASLIKYATQSKFGVQDDIIYAVVSVDGEEKIISAPHYHPFTRTLLAQMDESISSGKNFLVKDIAGNNKITLTYLAPVGGGTIPQTKEILRDNEFTLGAENELVGKERVTVEVNVEDIFSVYKSLIQEGMTIAHFYDY